ncbi:uncharacterized protein LOC129350162 [Amphiprion ocellaris]|uniref:uncharacterized protein LOC129350162 n=1 Tax=Amphiprion ocellaris TaxID=80972 RepID=UPI0024116785|nr:uncharacterized protein LOC129350162 [Amphiprion ocellaris]
MEAIYWHRTDEQQEGDSAAALLETFKNESFQHAKPPPPHGAPSSPASSPAPASTPVPARTPTLSTSTSSASQQSFITGKRKRGNRKLDLPSVLVEMQAEEEWSHAQHDENIQLLLSEARENEAALQREEMAQNAAFSQSFLGVLGQLGQAATDRAAGEPSPPLCCVCVAHK